MIFSTGKVKTARIVRIAKVFSIFNSIESRQTNIAEKKIKALCSETDKKGWHQVRLVGLTNNLYKKENAPADAFESAAAKRLRAGEASHEAVVTENGKQYLRYATPIPVVMEKCVMCHPSWKGEMGNVGSLMYKVPMID